MEINGGMNMVMEDCASRTLTDRIDKYYALWSQDGMSPSSLLPQLVAHGKKHLVEALLHIYGKGIVHYHIKGDNIMIMSDKRSIRLVDFGMAMAVESNPSSQDEEDEEDEAFRRRCC